MGDTSVRAIVLGRGRELSPSSDELGKNFQELADSVLGLERAAPSPEGLWNLDTQKTFLI